MSCVSTAAAAQTAVRQRDTRLNLLDHWVSAVDKHVPGEIDPPAVEMAKLKPAQRDLLLEMAAPFARFIRGEKLVVPHAPNPTELSVAEALRKRILSTGSLAAWLHRAVMFETDIAILAPELTAEAMRGDARGAGDAIHSDDGEAGARELLNWHWSFARDLLDARDPAASDAFPASWYHAVALYLLDQMLLAELEPHLIKGLELFPADARIQFDDACLADAFGSTRVQAVLISFQGGSFRPRIPAADLAHQTAMAQFARVIERDPASVEGRVRLARLYEQDGKAADALALLETAFTLPLIDETEYMAHLIAGRANGALGRTEAGVAHLKAAMELFPTAPTPVIAMSHLYLEAGDLDKAAELAVGLDRNARSEDRNDPWWSYFSGAWLGHRALLDQLRDGVRR